MTEEIKAGQIIEYDKDNTPHFVIDGVDVSGCEYYQIEANELYPKAQYCGSMRNTFCENEPNCYYKQLKRLEQENQELGKIINCKNGTIASLAEVRDKLKEENTKLKEKLEKIEEAITTCLTFHTCQKCKFYNECEMSLEEFILEIIRGEE